MLGCAQNSDSESDSKLQVSVSIPPVKTFVERIAGDLVDVNIMVKPGDNPAIYEPKPQQLVELKRSAAYFRIHVPFENAWMARFAQANPEMLIVDFTMGIDLVPIEDHQHDDAVEQANGKTLDPHIWLSPHLVKQIAEIIHEALANLDPEHEVEYGRNLTEFLDEINVLDAQLREILTGIENRKFIVFHPSWGYFARDYDLEMIAIESGGDEPSPAELLQIIAEAREMRARIIIAQPEFSTRAVEVIAEQIGAEVVTISPLALDWAESLRKLARAIAEQ